VVKKIPLAVLATGEFILRRLSFARTTGRRRDLLVRPPLQERAPAR
jgi:hypothetical protein